MIDPFVRTDGEETGADRLRASLSRGDALAGTVGPILRHLLANSSGAIFGDQVLARVRGMAEHLAHHFIDGPDPAAERLESLTATLLDQPRVLAHLHALSIEWQWTEWLEQRFGIDPVAPPLLHDAIASPVAETHNAGTRLLARQARWCQAQRRMQLEPGELPAEILQDAMLALRAHGADGGPVSDAEARIRSTFDEGAGRLGLSGRLISGLGADNEAALDLARAGPSLFFTALTAASGQNRDGLLLSTHGAQTIRLVLALRSAGLDGGQVARQMLMLHPDAIVPDGLDALTPYQAAAMLGDPDRGGH